MIVSNIRLVHGFSILNISIYSTTQQVKTEVPFGNLDNQSHLTTIGELIEEKENQMRNALHEIYFGKVFQHSLTIYENIPFQVFDFSPFTNQFYFY